MGRKLGYPIHKLKEIQSNSPANSSEVLMVLTGDQNYDHLSKVAFYTA